MEHQSGISGLRRKDTTKGAPLRVLSLDGGGVRGYSMLIILQELMHRTFVEIEGRAPKRHEIPKPCEEFDLIVGTGTGGLIALMLGRLRMDIETCKDVYVRMTKRVFETDKTIAGIPYRSTLFKASKLEEAIRECVREHTISEYEGNDRPTDSTINFRNSMSTTGSTVAPQRTLSNGSRYSQIGTSPVHPRSQLAFMKWGNPNALLYDSRESRTKTAVTAVYKGTPKGGNSVFLRSYDSRKEPSPEFNCTIWQAGRATSATGLAFKPIQIGHSMFIDEGAGTFNPAPQVLDEAVCNEWPGRDVGVFVSIGTGKRPRGTGTQQSVWWEGFAGGAMGDFAEARRRLIAKIEGCEDIHQFMLKEYLAKRGVNPENYFRLNVEVGVGEFGMNEWSRLAEISTNTRRYLSRDEVKNMNTSIASKLGRIHFAKARLERQLRGEPGETVEWDPRHQEKPYFVPPPTNPIAVELPAEDVPAHPHYAAHSNLLSPSQAHNRYSVASEEKIYIGSEDFSTPGSGHLVSPLSQRNSGEYPISTRRSYEQFGTGPRSSQVSISPRRSGEERRTPPPVPPKTPIQNPAATMSRPPAGIALPYPDTDGPPPVVNMARKPEFSR